MPTRRSAAAVASPPMPAPMIAILRGFAIVPARLPISSRPEAGARQRGSGLFRFKCLEKRSHRRPILARRSQREIIVLFGERNETQVGSMRDRRNSHAPVGAMLGDGGSNR